MIKAMGFHPKEDGDMETTGDGTSLYVVFSTDCGEFQQWQTYLLFFSAMRARQLGLITRIASGCTEEEKQKVERWHQEVCTTFFAVVLIQPISQLSIFYQILSTTIYLAHCSNVK
jgi:hypothetical protein